MQEITQLKHYKMEVIETKIPEVKVIVPKVFKDDRGYFFESFNQKEFEEKVCKTTFVQDNQSMSCAGTLRGLHWQMPPYAQSKLVRCVSGAVFDVAVDIRVGSPTYLEWVGVVLSEQNCKQLFIPRGFAHGFLALSSNAIFQYKCDNLYNKESEGAMAWDCVGIEWPLADAPILSDKDKLNKPHYDLTTDKLFDYNVNLYD